jgi:predicted acylesterase/phospholipase RssA
MRSSWQPYAVVFSGGGALGAWEVGCLEAIVAHEGYPPTTVIGSSAGAINAAGLCAGYDLEGLKKLWIDLRSSGVYRCRYGEWAAFGANLLYYGALTASLERGMRKAARRFHSILDAKPLEETLRQIFASRGATFFESETNFALAMTDLGLGRRVTLYRHGKSYRGPVPQSSVRRFAIELEENLEDLVDALMATCAIPLVFAPHEVRVWGGQTLRCFDGGVLRNCPIGPAVEFGETKIYVLIPSPESPRLASGVVDICQSLVETWVGASFESQLELVEHLNTARTSAGQEPIEIVTIRPPLPLEVYGVNQLSFGKNVATMIALGNEDATMHLRAQAVSGNKRQAGERTAEARTYTRPAFSKSPLSASLSILNRMRSIHK